MRISGILLTAAGLAILAFSSLPAAALPAGVEVQEGAGPGGVVETLPAVVEPELPVAQEGVRPDHPFKIDEELVELIKNRPITPGVSGARIIQLPSSKSGAQVPVPAAPSLETNFAGFTASNLAPPDPSMAVGPNHVVISVNLRFSVYDKSGTIQSSSNYATFFSNVNKLPFLFDPKVVYDSYAGRWIVLVLAVGDTSAAYLIAVSDDSDPVGTWFKYSSPAHLDGSTRTTNGPDFPGIGFDSSAVYITSNQFGNFVNGNFAYSKIRIFKKSELYNNAAPPLSYRDITRMVDPSDAQFTFTIKPVVPSGSISGTFLINTQGDIGNSIELWRLTNPTTIPVFSHRATIPIGSYSDPPDAAQPFGAPLVNTNGSSLQSEVHYQNGHLYFAFPQAYDFGSGSVSAIRYLEIDTTGAVIQNIIYGADGEHFFFPAPVPVTSGNVAMVFAHSSVGSYPSARFVGNFPDDMSAGVLKAGDTTYFCNFCGTRNRWGDYAGIWQDPVSPRRVWLYHEYVRKPQPNTWGTWVGAITLQNHAPQIVTPNPLNVNEQDTLTDTITVVEPDGEGLSSYGLLGALPGYATFTDLGGGKAVLKLTPSCIGTRTDTVYFAAADNALPLMADTLAIAINVLGHNCHPLLARSGPDTVHINQCQNRLFALSASDPDSTGGVTFSVAALPAFASVMDSGNGRGALSLSPTVADLGPYTVLVYASDGQDSGVLAVPVRVFQKGDLNQDSLLSPADIVLLLNCVFAGTFPPAGQDACDLDGGGATTADVVVLLNAAFLATPPPPC